MNFSNIKEWNIPEGSVTALRVNGIELWSSVPSNGLISFDNYLLKDINGLILIPKEDNK